jgi:hypothetical protein
MPAGRRVWDTKVEGREKLRESRWILAYLYFKTARPAYRIARPIRVHLRSSAALFVFRFSALGKEKSISGRR